MKFQVFGLLVALVFISGCATRNPSVKVFNPQNPYQTPNFSIERYKSPELRSSVQRQDVSVAIALSGGGHRAGNYGIGVLQELEALRCTEDTFNALEEIDYFSTVSGGSIAAGVYISTKYDHIQSRDKRDEYSLRTLIKSNQQDITRNLERGYHNILQKALINIKSLGNNDRGDFLEEEFDKKILGYEQRKKSLTLGDVFVSINSIKNPLTPMWVANATVYENGSIFPFNPETLKKYEVTQYTHHLKKWAIGSDYYSMPLSVGLKASASFPGVVPASTLASSFDPNNSFIHLFDGGLADNLGVTTALRLLSATGKNRKVLIIVDAYNGQPEPFSRQEGSPGALQIFMRTTGISLDAWRIRHKWVIEQLASSSAFKGETVEVIYLAFDGLPKKLKDKVFSIRTDFNITEEQQEDLFAAAKETVARHKDRIVRAIYEKPCRLKQH